MLPTSWNGGFNRNITELNRVFSSTPCDWWHRWVVVSWTRSPTNYIDDTDNPRFQIPKTNPFAESFQFGISTLSNTTGHKDECATPGISMFTKPFSKYIANMNPPSTRVNLVICCNSHQLTIAYLSFWGHCRNPSSFILPPFRSIPLGLHMGLQRNCVSLQQSVAWGKWYAWVFFACGLPQLDTPSMGGTLCKLIHGYPGLVGQFFWIN